MKFLAIRLAFRPLSGPVFADNMPGSPHDITLRPAEHPIAAVTVGKGAAKAKKTCTGAQLARNGPRVGPPAR
jgi:hypothetical protein